MSQVCSPIPIPIKKPLIVETIDLAAVKFWNSGGEYGLVIAALATERKGSPTSSKRALTTRGRWIETLSASAG
ncbi:hypothetical protein SH501x_002285 [Pirellulaceae bacterium SH501]